MTPQQQRAYDAYEYDLRIENVIDMAVEAAMTPSTGRLSEAVSEDLIGDLVTTRLHPSIKPLAEYLLDNGDDDDNLQLQLDDMAMAKPELMGVCLQVATPVRKWDEDGNSASFSWGHSRLNWIYGDTYDEAWARAVEWAKAQCEPPVKEA